MAPLSDLLWQHVLRRLFFTLDPETAHRMVLALLVGVPPVTAPTDAEALGQDLWGLHFSNPVGLAAGLDKDAAAVAVWQMLGFGFAEVGTVTPRPQPGNPRPRLWRLPEHQALINRLGFPSRGMKIAAQRLMRLRRRELKMRLGVNLGPNKDTPPDRVADDIAALAVGLGPMADFIVVNVSSPNTPGLREWQAPDHLRTLITRAFPNRLAAKRQPAAGVGQDRSRPGLRSVAGDLPRRDGPAAGRDGRDQYHDCARSSRRAQRLSRRSQRPSAHGTGARNDPRRLSPHRRQSCRSSAWAEWPAPRTPMATCAPARA